MLFVVPLLFFDVIEDSIKKIIFVDSITKSMMKVHKSLRPDGPDKLRCQVSQNLLHHLRHTIFGRPTPIPPCLLIHKEIRPTLSNKLPYFLHLINHLKRRNPLHYLFSYLLRSKMHSLDIVTSPDRQFFRVSLHKLNSSVDCVLHVHHREWCIFGEVAFVLLTHNCCLKHLGGIIGSTSSRVGSPAYQPGVPDTSHINSISLEVVVAPKFTCLFCNPVDRGRFLNGVLRTSLRGVIPESCNRTGPENPFAEPVSSSLECVEKRSHVSLFSIERVGLPGGREEGRQGVEISDLVFPEQIEEIFTVVDVEDLVVLDVEILGRVPNVCCDNVVDAVPLA